MQDNITVIDINDAQPLFLYVSNTGDYGPHAFYIKWSSDMEDQVKFEIDTMKQFGNNPIQRVDHTTKRPDYDGVPFNFILVMEKWERMVKDQHWTWKEYEQDATYKRIIPRYICKQFNRPREPLASIVCRLRKVTNINGLYVRVIDFVCLSKVMV
jgi:hypothetical protein